MIPLNTDPSWMTNRWPPPVRRHEALLGQDDYIADWAVRSRVTGRFHLLKMLFLVFVFLKRNQKAPVGLKGIYHYWKYVFMFSRGLKQMEVAPWIARIKSRMLPEPRRMARLAKGLRRS